MGNMPWHPAVGHLPLGLAFMTPLLAIGLTWAIWRDWLPKRSWWILVVFQALLVGAGLVTIKTGENEVMLLAVAGTIVVAGLALRAGRAGGELVYVHGAAASYTTEGAAQAPGQLRGAAREQKSADED